MNSCGKWYSKGNLILEKDKNTLGTLSNNNFIFSWYDNYRLFAASPFIRNQEELFEYSEYIINKRFASNPPLPAGVYRFGDWKVFCDVFFYNFYLIRIHLLIVIYYIKMDVVLK